MGSSSSFIPFPSQDHHVRRELHSHVTWRSQAQRLEYLAGGRAGFLIPNTALWWTHQFWCFRWAEDRTHELLVKL